MSWNNSCARVPAVAVPAGNATSCVSVLPAAIVATSIVKFAAAPPPKLASSIVIVLLITCPCPAVITVILVTAPEPSTTISNVPTVPVPELVPVTPVYVPAVLKASAPLNESIVKWAPAGVFVIAPLTQMLSIIDLICNNPLSVNVVCSRVVTESSEPNALISVERNSSPITAVPSGTIIGNVSLYIPVFTNNVLYANASGGIVEILPAEIASVIIAANS